MNRKAFLDEVMATQAAGQSEDKIYKKYANKTLPKAYKTTAYLNQYAGPWTATQVRHLLRRTMLGAKETDVQALMAMSMSDAVDYLINNTPANPAPPVNSYDTAGNVDITGVAAGQTWVNAPAGTGNLNDQRRYSYKAWWYGLMINQNLSITEKMIFFWHNHFATQTYVVGEATLSYNHHLMLRSNALGNYRDFVKAVTKDAAMLRYLNGNVNTKNAPDENYARELQELFTVGKFNTPNYTEADVKAAAKVLTGWMVNDSTFTGFFMPALHDTTDKQFSSFYNNTIISGQTGSNGAHEADSLVDMIFTWPEVAHYLCTKLYRFFVYYNIDTNIDINLIAPLAQVLIDNNFEIKPVLQRLLKSDHFYDPLNIGSYVKTPLDLMVGTFRTFNVNIPGTLDAYYTYNAWNYLGIYCARTGLDLGDPPNVAGWQPFYEAPAYYEIWINSSTFPLRMQFTDTIAGNGYSVGTGTPISIDIMGFIKQYSNASDPDQLISYLVTRLLGVAISSAEQNNLKSILLSGQTTNSYWTTAWDNYLADPSVENTSIVLGRLSSLLTTMFRLPEYQLC